MSKPEPTSIPEQLRSLWKDEPTKPRAAAPSGIPAAQNGNHLADPVTDELIWSFLVWEAGEKRAAEKFDDFVAHFVDLNDLRVCLTSEIVAATGHTYPKAADRAERLRATLADIYQREHGVTLAHLKDLGKREARAYLDSLDGIPPYVAARVALVALGSHAFPLDDRLNALLSETDVLIESNASSTADAAAWLERQIRAGDAAELFQNIEVWAADRSPKKTSSSRKKTTRKSSATGSKTSAKKTSRKTT